MSLAQAPFASQWRGVREHVEVQLVRVGFGVQATQAPFKHTGALPEQSVAFCQLPAALHTRGVLESRQSFEFGLQATHAPFKHAGVAPEQAAPFCHLPAPVQVRGVVASPQSTLLGEQATQAPFRHAGVEPAQSAPFCQAPASLQLRGVLASRQSLLRGVQATHLPFKQSGVEPEQAVENGFQWPVVSQNCGALSMHSLGCALGVHTPQSLPTHMYGHVKPVPQVPSCPHVLWTPATH